MLDPKAIQILRTIHDSVRAVAERIDFTLRNAELDAAERTAPAPTVYACSSCGYIESNPASSGLPRAARFSVSDRASHADSTAHLDPNPLPPPLPCPWCGGAAAIFKTQRGELFGVQCSTNSVCGITTLGPHRKTIDEAIAAWNRRATSQPDAVTKAAMELAKAYVALNQPFPYSKPRTDRLDAASGAYAVAVAGAGKGAQS